MAEHGLQKGAATMLDAVDWEIIALLQDDGRMSSSEIARRLGGLTDRAVRNRIDRLVRGGVIRVGAIINAASLGLPATSNLILEVAPWKLRDVAASLSELPEVAYLAVGPHTGQLSMRVHVECDHDVFSFVRDVVSRLDGVIRITTGVTPMLINGWTGFFERPAPSEPEGQALDAMSPVRFTDHPERPQLRRAGDVGYAHVGVPSRRRGVRTRRERPL
jgi:Lrp/AsnC family transcriptional regulator for asnA, asnC and gidA